MDYIKIKFGNEFGRLASDIEKSIESMFRPRPVSPMFTACEHTWSPQVDIYETPQEVIIRVEVAGVDKESLGVEINHKAVRIYGNRCELAHTQDGAYRLAEIQYGEFERILYLPTPIDIEVVSSSYSNGLLQIRLAKLPMDVTHKIPIADG